MRPENPRVLIYDFTKGARFVAALFTVGIILGVVSNTVPYGLSKAWIPWDVGRVIYIAAIPLSFVAVRVTKYRRDPVKIARYLDPFSRYVVLRESIVDVYLNLGGFVIPLAVSIAMVPSIVSRVVDQPLLVAYYLLVLLATLTAAYYAIRAYPSGTYFISPEMPVLYMPIFLLFVYVMVSIAVELAIQAITGINVFRPPYKVMVDVVLSSAWCIATVAADVLKVRNILRLEFDESYKDALNFDIDFVANVNRVVLGAYGIMDIIFAASIVMLFNSWLFK